MTTIYFVRHAEPERSKDSPYTDSTYPLTEKGLKDRQLVTAFLRDKNIDVVLSSPFKRAVDTVAHFAEEIGCKIELTEDFRERAIADKWIGLDEWKLFAKKQWEDYNYKLPGGECIAEVQKRNLAALKDVLQRYEGKNIVVGAHGMSLSSILHHYDSGFGFAELEAMPMPWVAKMVFDGENCYDCTTTDLFAPDKKSNICRVTMAELGELKTYRYTVIFARYKDQWLYCRHKDRDVFETPGGGIEPGETPLECASRELREETGAVKFSIFPAFDYSVYADTGFSHGQVFYADIKELGELSAEFEMTEVRGFTTIPDKMRFPQILPVLYAQMYKWLGRDKLESEFWDVFDENRNPTGRLHRRTDPMQSGDFHTVVRIWVMNKKGEFLITRRAFNKLWAPGLWEIPGGSVQAGEESLAAAVREISEECGLTLFPENAELISTEKKTRAFFDNWLFRQEFDPDNVVLQEGETINAQAATWDEIAEMMDCGTFMGRDAITDFEKFKNLGNPARMRPMYKMKRFWLGIILLCIFGYFAAMMYINDSQFYIINGNRVHNFEIVDGQYRLGGGLRIGVGSTRRRVEADFRLRLHANGIGANCGCGTMRLIRDSDIEFGYHVHGISVLFEFDENNIVTRIRIQSIG